ncbi:MAG: 16S rRNA (cytosine(967)-C(5))-methyltransferase RsmB [Candidatus Magnetomorum sp.]|nr:16S rRNA (cytosine(967)-C(5))-methyltransferase RsmB [Candidatus Magnetomorum sp.]
MMKLKITSVQKKLASPSQKNPRVLSLFLLNDFQIKDYHLDTLISEAFDHAPSFDQRDRSLVFSLVYGVIRWQTHLDFVIQQFSKTPFSKIALPISNVLRMGIFQLLFMNRIPDHAAVNSSVELTRIFAENYLVRFVNGVLRQTIRSKTSIQWPDESDTRVDALSVRYAYPGWLIHRWMDQWGQEKTKAMCIASNTIPKIVLRSNTLSITRENLIESLLPSAKEVLPTSHAPDGIWIAQLNEPLDQMESFKSGGFQVQDEAAQLIGLMVSPKAGESILDACAGRGGKTGHLAQCMNNQGSILAVDQAAHKLETLSAEMNRLGVSIVKTFQHQWEKPLAPILFDRILLDAPCSGLGVIRRHPDMKWKKSKQDIVNNQKQQERLLDTVSTHLKPGGQLIYAVCSLEPEETIHAVETFLLHHPNFTIETHLDPILEPFLNHQGYFMACPDEHQMDGFFAVCFTFNE